MPKENKITIPGPPCGYTDLLDHEIMREQSREQEEFKKLNTTPYNPLRPSSAGKCARQLAYELMAHKGHAQYDIELKPPNVYRLLKLGHSIEFSVLRLFTLVKYVNVDMKQQKVICFELEKLSNEKIQQLIIGSVDACLINKQWKTLMDVKSVKDSFSRAFKTKWDETLDKYSRMSSLVKLSSTAFYADDVVKFLDDLGEDWLYENICQINSYALSPFMKSIGIDNGVVYKYCKNDSRHYEIRFKPSQELADYVKDKFDAVNKAVAQKKPEDVQREHALGSMHCAFCPFNKTCWPNYDTKKEWFKTFPKKKWPTDIGKIADTASIKSLFTQFEKAEEETKTLKEIEKKIVKELVNSGVDRVRLDNGNVYELKRLKSPRERLELRRTKL